MIIKCELDEIIDLSKTLNNAIEYSCENGEDSSYAVRLSNIIYEKLRKLKDNINNAAD